MREFKAAARLSEWKPVLTAKEATEAAIRKRDRLAKQAAASHTHSPGTTNSTEVIELRKSVDDMNRNLHDNLAAMQKSIQESLIEMNNAMLAIAALVKSTTEAQRLTPQREQLKKAIQTTMRPAIASLQSVKRSAAKIPTDLSGSITLPDIALDQSTFAQNINEYMQPSDHPD